MQRVVYDSEDESQAFVRSSERAAPGFDLYWGQFGAVYFNYTKHQGLQLRSGEQSFSNGNVLTFYSVIAFRVI